MGKSVRGGEKAASNAVQERPYRRAETLVLPPFLFKCSGEALKFTFWRWSLGSRRSRGRRRGALGLCRIHGNAIYDLHQVPARKGAIGNCGGGLAWIAGRSLKEFKSFKKFGDIPTTIKPFSSRVIHLSEHIFGDLIANINAYLTHHSIEEKDLKSVHNPMATLSLSNGVGHKMMNNPQVHISHSCSF